MMFEKPPLTAKWPFLALDAILLVIAGYILHHAKPPFGWMEIGSVSVLGSIAAWVGVTPFLRDHQAAVKLYEQANLSDTLTQIGELQSVAQKIGLATSQWQGVQEASAKTVASANSLVERMQVETKTFGSFLTEADQREKQTLRLELEKLRRSEQDTLQVIVHLLDHVFALFQAGVRSGQDPLIAQLGQFRAACLDATRRIGLVAHDAHPGDPFDPNLHQTVDGTSPEPGTPVTQCIACGYSFQGHGLRRIVVAIEGQGTPSSAASEPTAGSTPDRR